MIRALQPFALGLIGVALFTVTSVAVAHGYDLGDIGIAHPYAVPTPPGATTGGGYIKELSNKGDKDDRLVSASSPAADHVELHTMSMDGNVMRMRQVEAIVIPPHGHVDMAPGGGYHMMLIGIRQPLKVGDKIPVKLTFERAGTIEVELHVQERDTMTGMHMH